MVDKDDVLEKIAYILGTLGHVMVYVGIIASTMLFWYILFKML
jgi:hypothetical protein